MVAYQGAPAESTVYLVFAALPVTGVVASQVVVQYKKFGQTTLTTKTLAAGDWAEIGGGYYTLKWSALETNTVGNFFFQVTNVTTGTFNPFVSSFSIEYVPVEIANLLPDLCLVSGVVYDVGGNPLRNLQIKVRPIRFPMGDPNGNIIGSLPASAVTDHNGRFQIELIQGKTVMIDFATTGINNQQITVPYAPTALLTDLIPPFCN